MTVDVHDVYQYDVHDVDKNVPVPVIRNLVITSILHSTVLDVVFVLFRSYSGRGLVFSPSFAHVNMRSGTVYINIYRLTGHEH